MVETLQPGQDWVWCNVDELSLRRVGGGWVHVDLFFEAGSGAGSPRCGGVTPHPS